MLFSEVLDPNCVIEFDAATPEETLQRLVEPLAATGAIMPYETPFLVGKLLAREAIDEKQTGRRLSTGGGFGIAMPHARGKSLVREIGLVVGRNNRPVDWQPSDRIPVQIFFCIIFKWESVRIKLYVQQLVSTFALWAPIDALIAAEDFKKEFLRVAAEYDERERARSLQGRSS